MRFKRYKDKIAYPNDYVFSVEELRTITPEDKSTVKRIRIQMIDHSLQWKRVNTNVAGKVLDTLYGVGISIEIFFTRPKLLATDNQGPQKTAVFLF